jgi:hypothetical protein
MDESFFVSEEGGRQSGQSKTRPHWTNAIARQRVKEIQHHG